MNPFTVEEMNLLSIYRGESKEEVTEKIAFALSFMDSDTEACKAHGKKGKQPVQSGICRAFH